MHSYVVVLLVVFFLLSALKDTKGLEMPKEKRGWTLNSVGYLLGPGMFKDGSSVVNDVHRLFHKQLKAHERSLAMKLL
uniref:Galanin domain-containing protein n=1 Tax=Eptatretus burgeri TaxID=7764 RepID=A0A8C4WYA4_EPTBU